MPIFNANANATKAMWGGIRHGTLSLPSTTAMILASLAITRPAGQPAGDGIRYTHQLETADGGVYSAFDKKVSTNVKDKTVSTVANWFNFYAESGLANTDIIKNQGRTVQQLIDQNVDISSLSIDERIAFFSLQADADTKASAKIQNDFSAALWNGNASSVKNADHVSCLDDLFNEDKPWDGVAPNGLGSWGEGHPWADGNAPNTLTGAKHNYINIPQIFDADSPRDLTYDLVKNWAISTQAMRGNGTLTLVPCDDYQFGKLTSEFNKMNIDQVLFGIEGWALSINAILFYGMLFYLDVRAPKDRLRGIHVGTPGQARTQALQINGIPQTDAGLCLVFWTDMMPGEAQMALQRRTPEAFQIPASSVGIEIPRNTMLPFMFTAWDRDGSSVNAATRNVELMVAIFGPTRYKHTELRSLTTG